MSIASSVRRLFAALALMTTTTTGAAAATTVAAPLPPPATQASPALAARLDALATAEFARAPQGGMTVGVVRNGVLIWSETYGVGDVATGSKIDSESIYRVGSVTKQFTALMLLQLANEGVVHLSDPVEKWFPEINRVQGRYPGAPPVTLIQLATHTSGLAAESDDPNAYSTGAVASWESTLIAALPRTRYAYEPGTRYSYSNVDYAILGAALSRAAKTPYIDYVRKRILRPLGMTRTSFEVSPPLTFRLARGYVAKEGALDGTIPLKELNGRGYKIPGGGAYSTLADLTRYLSFEMGHGPDAVLPRDKLIASRELLVAGNANLDGGYGLGFQIFPGQGFVMQGHLGGVAGYRALDAFDRKTNVGVIILRNVSGDAVDLLSLGAALIRTTREEVR